MKKIKTLEKKVKKEPLTQKNEEKITKEQNEPTREILSLTKQLVELDVRYEEASKLKAKLFNEKKRLQGELAEKMKEQNLESFRSSEFGLIYSYNKFWVRITDMEAAEAWLTENGLFDEILKLAPKNERLNEIMKERLEKGETIPAGFDYSITRNIGIRST